MKCTRELCPKTLEGDKKNNLSGMDEKDSVVNFFSHSGTILIVGERLKIKIYAFDIE